jgi:hypothetical protein
MIRATLGRTPSLRYRLRPCAELRKNGAPAPSNGVDAEPITMVLRVWLPPVGGIWGIGSMLLSVGMTLSDPLQPIRLGVVTEGNRV